MSINPAGLAVTAALTGLNMLLTATKKIEGPRLENLTASVADYGTPYNYFYGRRRFECACVFAEPITEQKKKRKTKGGKYTDYTYFGTWASVISDHEIDDVLRIWFDRHLVYDRTSDGPGTILALGEGYEIEGAMRIYLGTEDQMPDPRMQAFIEDEDGAGSCPALRGRSYIFFEDIPLEKLGNRLPQVSVEAVRGSVSNSWTLTKADSTVTSESYVFVNPVTRRIYLAPAGSGTGEAHDADSLALLHPLAAGSFGGVGVDFYGRSVGQEGTLNLGALRGSDENGQPGLFSRFGRGGNLPITDEINEDGAQFLNGANWTMISDLTKGYKQTFVVHWGRPSLECFTIIDLEKLIAAGDDEIEQLGSLMVITSEPSQMPGGQDEWRAVIPKLDGTGFYAFFDDAGEHKIFDVNLTGGYAAAFSSTQIGALPMNDPNVFPDEADIKGWAINRNTGYLVLSTESATVIYDPINDVVINQSTTMPSIDASYLHYSGKYLGILTGGVLPVAHLVDMDSMEVVQQVSAADESELIDAYDNWGWDDERQGLIFCTDGEIKRLVMNIADTDDYPLADIIDDICDRSGMAVGDYNTDLVTDGVVGYSWTQGSGRDIIEPLLDLYDIDARPNEYQLQFLPRGNASAGNIETADLVASRGSEDRYEISIIDDYDLPFRVFLNFADSTNDQQPNAAKAQRDNDTQDSNRELTIDMSTWAATPDEARQLLERMFRRKWFTREEVSARLTPQELALEPADVITLDLDGAEIVSRLIENNIDRAGVMSTKWQRDLAAISTVGVFEGAAMAGRLPSEIPIPVGSMGFILDVPLLYEDQEDPNPFIYFAAAPVIGNAFWPGADIFESPTGSPDDFEAGWDSVPANRGATWGKCTNALNSGAVPNVIDDGSALVVSLMNGSLSSITREQMLADDTSNLAIVGSAENGWEVVQFQNAFLESDGSYLISGFVRGSRGTEAQMDGHQTYESILIVNQLDVAKHILPVSELGTETFYRTVTQGRDILSAITQSVTFSAAPLKPLSPAHVELSLDSGSGDWTIDWIRRTRIGGSLIDERDVPLAQESEAYKVQIMDGTTVVRTIETTSETATYSSADQTTDWGSPQSSLSVRVLQVAPSTGIDGFYTAASA